jgi:hypothetical protein
MYKIKTNTNNKLVAIGEYGEETIHLIHCAETIEDLKEDVATPFIVLEECSNFARIHLVTDFSEDEALQQVDEYLRENEGDDDDEPNLIGVFEAELSC